MDFIRSISLELDGALCVQERLSFNIFADYLMTIHILFFRL